VPRAPGIMEAYNQLALCDHYLLLRDTHGQVAVIQPGSDPTGRFPSQYFRRVLAAHFGLDAPWDWREYDFPEPALLDVLEHFGSCHASLA